MSSSETRRTHTSRCRATLPQGHAQPRGPILMNCGGTKEYHTPDTSTPHRFFLHRASGGSCKVVSNTAWNTNFPLPSYNPLSCLLPLPSTCVDSRSPLQHILLLDTISDFAFLRASPLTQKRVRICRTQRRNETTLGNL